jgi:hypothetical protein
MSTKPEHEEEEVNVNDESFKNEEEEQDDEETIEKEENILFSHKKLQLLHQKKFKKLLRACTCSFNPTKTIILVDLP